MKIKTTFNKYTITFSGDEEYPADEQNRFLTPEEESSNEEHLFDFYNMFFGEDSINENGDFELM